MCQTIIIGDKEIETAAEFKEHFGFDALIAEGCTTIHPDACLCQVDVEETFRQNEIKWTYDAGSMWYIVEEKRPASIWEGQGQFGGI